MAEVRMDQQNYPRAIRDLQTAIAAKGGTATASLNCDKLGMPAVLRDYATAINTKAGSAVVPVYQNVDFQSIGGYLAVLNTAVAALP